MSPAEGLVRQKLFTEQSITRSGQPPSGNPDCYWRIEEYERWNKLDYQAKHKLPNKIPLHRMSRMIVGSPEPAAFQLAPPSKVLNKPPGLPA